MAKISDISIIIPIYNGSYWIDQCFESIIKQDCLHTVKLEICVCNDASSDKTLLLLNNWPEKLNNYNIDLKVYNNDSHLPRGVGFARNKAVSISTGTYLCFQDIDDIMLPERISKQFEMAISTSNNTLIGSQFRRCPDNSTKRLTKWANSLTPEQLNVQIYTSHGPTVIMPTWFCHRSIFERIGGFCEAGEGVPEDLLFFYSHLDLGGQVVRVDHPLLIYTYHRNATTFSIDKWTIWQIRVKRLEREVLSRWPEFTIWNGGKQGRQLYKSLSLENQNKITAFCDVDKNKIGKQYISYNEKLRKSGKPIDIIHFRHATPPFVICMKIDLTNGEFENNLHSLKLRENEDYILFS